MRVMRKLAGLIVLLVLSACAPLAPLPTLTPLASSAVALTPYRTATPILTPSLPANQPTNTPLPTSTATPRTHTVAQGEDMSGIALRYRVSLDALKTANPSANPRLILVGQVLVIPAGTPPPGATAQPTPTAAKILADPPRCLRDEAGGAWCFTLVRNTQSTPVESVTVRLRLVDGQGKQIAAQVISTALDLLPAGKTLPAGAYFPAPLPAVFQAAGEVVSALPVKDETSRYLAVKIENQKTTLAADSASASVSGKLTLVQPERKARLVKVAAAGYAADGSLAGLRIWEGQSLEFNFTLYTVSAKISRVEVLAEARP